MPELPEIETIRNLLRLGGPDTPSLLGMTIFSVQLLWERSLAIPSPAEFLTRLPGQEICEIQRRGKFLYFGLSQEVLLFHLRMSGDIVLKASDAPRAMHDRLVLRLQKAEPAAGALKLAFNDPRKFGRIWLVSDPQSVLGSLGPEPLDSSFTAKDLYERLHAKRRQLKPLLLDQSFLAGMGNIYTDEALFSACLHPLTPSNTITHMQAERLWETIRQVLTEAIRHNGASIDWVYRGGDFQNYFQVYQRTGQPCLRCGSLVQRILVGQRGTHFCPNCQTI